MVECQICYELEDIRVLRCGHNICYECAKKIVERQHDDILILNRQTYIKCELCAHKSAIIIREDGSNYKLEQLTINYAAKGKQIIHFKVFLNTPIVLGVIEIINEKLM